MNLSTTTQQPALARITLPRDHPDVQAAERAGIDINAIEDNLNLTYEQRIEKHERARALIYERGLSHLLEDDSLIIDQNLRIIRGERDDLATKELRAIAAARKQSPKN